ncbi:MAG TPA: class I SAM-dependent methyltransferase [Solirubrobacteraceae bacterium]
MSPSGSSTGDGGRPAAAVVWHDVECGGYTADLPLWLELAAGADGPILDVGAGTGRVALGLARAGHAVHALERDPDLAGALEERARGLAVVCIVGDACAFTTRLRFPLCIVPMQTIHLLEDRPAFLRCAHAALEPGGRLAIALLGDGVEEFEMELDADRASVDGVLYESRPTALRYQPGAIVLERRRRTETGKLVQSADDLVRLAVIDPDDLAADARAVGFVRLESRWVAPTADQVGSEILMLVRPAGPS